MKPFIIGPDKTSSRLADTKAGSPLLAHLKRFVAAVERSCASIRKSNEAAAMYRHLSHLSDAQLAARGIDREDIAKVILKRYYGIK